MPWGTPDITGEGDDFEPSMMISQVGSGRQEVFYPAKNVPLYPIVLQLE